MEREEAMQRLPDWVKNGCAVIGVVAILALLLGFERVILSPVDAPCKAIRANVSGTGGATMTVDATVGGVTVLAASTTRCVSVIQNEAGGGDIRCAFGATAPTTTVGFLVQAGQNLPMGLEGQVQVRCIRTGATNGTVSVAEAP